MTGCDCQHIFPVSCCRTHSCKGERFSRGGTGPVQTEHGDLQRLHSHGCGDALPQQVSAEEISDLVCFHMCFPQGEHACFFLHGALSLFPCLCAEQIVFICHIEELSQRAGRLFTACHRGGTYDIGCIFKEKALFSFYYPVHIDILISVILLRYQYYLHCCGKYAIFFYFRISLCIAPGIIR